MIDLLEPEPAGPALPKAITADRWTHISGWLCPPALRHLVEQRRDERGRVEWRLRARLMLAPAAAVEPARVPAQPHTPYSLMARQMLAAGEQITAADLVVACGGSRQAAATSLQAMERGRECEQVPGQPGVYRAVAPSLESSSLRLRAIAMLRAREWVDAMDLAQTGCTRAAASRALSLLRRDGLAVSERQSQRDVQRYRWVGP